MLVRKQVSINKLKLIGDKHLIYELRMFKETVSILKTNIVQENDTLRHAVIESFGIHLRTLIKFFFDTNPYPTDVVASDFYEDPKKWEEIRSKLNDDEVIDTIYYRVNKEIVHLTYDRLDVKPEEKAWLSPGDEGYHLIRRALHEFLKTVPNSRIGEQLALAKLQVMNNS